MNQRVKYSKRERISTQERIKKKKKKSNTGSQLSGYLSGILSISIVVPGTAIFSAPSFFAVLGSILNQNPFSAVIANPFLFSFIGMVVLEQGTRLHLANRWNSKTFVSNIANLFPMHILGPIPNVRNRPELIICFVSFKNLSGSNLSGSG